MRTGSRIIKVRLNSSTHDRITNNRRIQPRACKRTSCSHPLFGRSSVFRTHGSAVGLSRGVLRRAKHRVAAISQATKVGRETFSVLRTGVGGSGHRHRSRIMHSSVFNSPVGLCMPNEPAAPNSAIASRLNSGHYWHGVGERDRSTTCAFF